MFTDKLKRDLKRILFLEDVISFYLNSKGYMIPATTS